MSNAGYIRSGLLQRGLPGHVADAFIVNFRDESGLNPGINEAKPLVPGSRGGFGLYQLTGPRRREYEAFASRRGVQPSDVDAQLDFLMGELQGSERRAGQRILAAPDTATAAQAIVNDFLRPAASHRAKRSARYASLGGGASAYNAEPQPSGASSAIDSILGTNNAPQGPMAYGGDTVAQGGRMGGLGGLGGFTPPSQDVGLDTGAILRALGAGLIAGDASAVPAYLQQAIADQQRNVDRDYEREWQQYAFRTGLEENALERQDRAAERADNQSWRQDERAYQRGRDLISDQQFDRTLEARMQPEPGFRLLSPEDAQRMNLPEGQAYQVGGDGKIQPIGGSGVTVNLPGQPNIGTIPQGYAASQDANGNWSMAPIPGGPEDTAVANAAAAGNRDISTGIITNAATRAREAYNTSVIPTTGTIGRVAANFPETGASEVRRHVAVLQANAKIENLQAMRDASPTGGALGAVSDSENAMLAAKSGALDPDSPTFMRDLEDYERTLLQIVHGPQAGDNIFSSSRAPVAEPAAPPMQEPLTSAVGASTVGRSFPMVRSDADFDALPPGAQFYDPQGNLRTKPNG